MSYWTNPGLEFASNNGTLAIRPTGRLSPLRKLTHDRMQKCWVFGDPMTYTDHNGDVLFDHQRRGVMMGTWEEGLAFIKSCQDAGIQVDTTGFYVPFSNGKGRYGHFEDGTPFSEYSAEELRMVRIDELSVRLFECVIRQVA